jgi:choline kinase
MRAIILAAGAGTRLQPLTDDCPKCLVDIGGQTLIDYQLQALRSVGVDDVVLVVGCKEEQVRAHCGDAVRYISNADYLSTNSIDSLYLAASEFDVAVFLFNCDILFQPEVLQRLLGSGYGNAVAVDSGVELVANEMNVRFGMDRQVTAISKALDPASAQAQSVQLVKFDAAGAQQVQREVQRLVEGNYQDAFPTSAYGTLIEEGKLFAVEVGDLSWGEIDSVEDHENAKVRVLPALVA